MLRVLTGKVEHAPQKGNASKGMGTSKKESKENAGTQKPCHRNEGVCQQKFPKLERKEERKGQRKPQGI